MVTFLGTCKSKARGSEAPSSSAAPAPPTSALPSITAPTSAPAYYIYAAEPASRPAFGYAEFAGCGSAEACYEGFVGVYHQLLALQWHIQGKAQSWLDCGGEFHVSPPRFKRHVHD